MLIELIGNTVILIGVWMLFRYINRKYFILSLAKRIKTQDGSPLKDKVFILPGKTRFGNNFDILKMTPAMLFRFVRDAYIKANGRSYLWYFLFAPVYNVVCAEDAEEIFQSTKLITKNIVYELLRPFMGDGLLISTDRKWHKRRKMLTPAFHFNVLQQFLDIFKEECNKLVDILYRNVDDELDLSQLIPQFTLNNVCETALGVKLDDMVEGAQYREAIHALETIMVERTCNPLMYYSSIFYLCGSYKKHKTNLKLAHDFASHIIKRKRSQIKQQTELKSYIGKKQRYAMLDTLLEAETEGLIDHQGICDEVNTFMFEGYDTTSTCLIFTLLMLALNDDVQNRCFMELQHISRDDNNLNVFNYNQLDYLESVIKESLRLFPPVPFLGRVCTEETVINGLIMPKGTQINIHVFDVMRDPRHFSNPLKFEPERFLQQNTSILHPFSFVPFSAGQRNCIGQKFAVTRLEDIIFEYGIVLRSQQNVRIKLERREE